MNVDMQALKAWPSGKRLGRDYGRLQVQVPMRTQKEKKTFTCRKEMNVDIQGINTHLIVESTSLIKFNDTFLNDLDLFLY